MSELRKPAGNARPAPKKKPTSSAASTAAKKSSTVKKSTTVKKSATVKKAPAKAASRQPVKAAARPVAKAPAKSTAKSRAASSGVKANPVARTSRVSASAVRRSAARDDLFDVSRLRSTPARSYDELEFPAERSRTAGKGGRRSGGGWLTLFLCTAICLLGCLMAWQTTKYARFRQMRAVVEQQTFYDGTMVDGIDVSGMTYQQAQQKWADEIEPAYAGRTVTFDNGKTVTAAELGYESNYLNVLGVAWDAGRYGSLEERYENIYRRKSDPTAYSVARVLFRDELVDRYVQAAAKALDRSPTEPGIESLNMETFEFSFREGEPGRALDQQRMAQDIRDTLNSGSGSVQLVLNDVQPEHRVEDIRDDYGLIASAQTNASSSSSARLNNISLALSAINGARIQPGETFSFNDTVGKRTTERGYKPAGAYSAGEVVEEVGGGICQVSTTLFNAVVKADLEITERHNHSMPVGYVDKGKDATVNWGNQNFRFTNNTDSEVYIGAYLTSDKRVRVGVFGRLIEDGKYITIEAVTTGTLNFTTIYETSFELAPGQQNVRQEGHNGYTAEAYKIVWDKDGNQLDKSLLCTSRYAPRDRIIETGP